MKKNFTQKTLFSFLCLIIFSFSTKISTAQTLEEIPNPTNYTLNWFTGGEEGNLFFEYLDQNFYTDLFHFDGMDLNAIPYSGDLNFPAYSHEYDGQFYFTGFDANFYQSLIQYDGDATAIDFPIPAGLNYGSYVGEYDSKMYVSLFDNNFNAVLYQYDGTDFTEIVGPADLTFGNFITIFDDVMYLSYFDANFNNQMMAFDGTTFTPIANPAGVQYSFYIGETDDQMYLSFFEEINFTNFLYLFDGTTFTEIPNPSGFQFSWEINLDPDGGTSYLSYFDANFYNFIFELNGTTLTQLPIPTGFQFPFYVNKFDGRDFFGMYDNNFNQFLFGYDGTDFVEVDAPAGYTYSQYADTLLGNAYYVYYDANFNNHLTKLEAGSNSTIEVTGPTDFTYSNFAASVNDKDNSVTTFINTPYFFEQDDFTFADTDGSDSLSSIMITEVETVGNLFLNGAHVYVGDIIPTEELSDLVFFPNTDDEGMNYDVFTFRVSDGDDFSDAEYTMTINVVDAATSTDDNFLNANVLLYPIPADEFTTLQINATQAIEELNVRIVSMNGQVVLRQTFEQIGEEFQHQFDLTNLASGQYILHGISPNGIVAKTISVEK